MVGFPFSYDQVLLFMKGNKMFPQCGFSNTAVQIMQALEV
jgi:monothiol glutaredoxin